MSCSYVIVDLRCERCRAKNPGKCRYHVAPDGTPLKHYLDAAEADSELAAVRKALAGNGAAGKKATAGQASKPATRQQKANDGVAGETAEESPKAMDAANVIARSLVLDEMDADFDVDMSMPIIDDYSGQNEQWSVSETDDRVAKPDYGETAVGVDEATLERLNSLRRQAAISSAACEVAGKLKAAVREAMDGSGEWFQELAWTGSSSPVRWPEWWSTREDLASSGLQAEFTDGLQQEARWSEDGYGAGGEFGSRLETLVVGTYDAVRAGIVEWADLRRLGASSCWMAAVAVHGGSVAEPETETAVAWCGRRPAAAGEASPDHRAVCKTLAEAMRKLEALAVGWSQATVEIHVSK